MSPLRTGWNSFSNFFIFAIISILKFKICFLVLGNPLTELHIFKILLCNTPSTFSPNCFSKGTVQRDFRTPFFTSFEPAWVKTFSILAQILLSYSNFYNSPWGMIPRQDNVPWVSFPGKSSDFSGSLLKGLSN